jgi:small conductance mechanosensitive channel
MICASLNRPFFIVNLLRYLAEKILLLNTTNFRGDYPTSKISTNFSAIKATLIWRLNSTNGSASTTLLDPTAHTTVRLLTKRSETSYSNNGSDSQVRLGYQEGNNVKNLINSFFAAEWLENTVTNIVVAAVILFLTLWCSTWIKKRIIYIGYKYEKLDDTLFVFLSKIAQVLILIFGGTVILNKFGVQTTSIIALLGAASLAVGLALQGTLSNFAAGIMLIAFRPFQKGDYVSVSGSAGTVKEISIFTTELATPDNIQVIVPNGQIWGASISNYSAYDTRRVDLVFSISYGSDLQVTEDILVNLISNDKRIHTNPEPLIKVGKLNNSSVDFTVRVWCDRSDYWHIKFDMTRSVKEAFDKGGVDIPYPTTTIINAN